MSRKVTPKYNLAILNPDVAKEWGTTKNGILTAKDVTPGSGKKVWWRCGKGHEWNARIASRTEGGTGCPHCHNEIRGKFRNGR